MLRSGSRDFDLLRGIAVRLNKTAAKLVKSVAQKQIAPISLLSVLGLAGVSWLTTVAIAPQSAQAYTASLSIALSRQTNENFNSLLRRAEAVARAAAQRSFDRDILVSNVAITVTAQNEGSVVPLLSLRASRQAWRNRPDPQRWITYFPNTQTLLGIKDTQEQPGITPAGVPGQPPDQAPPPAPVPATPSSAPIQIPGTQIRIVPNPNGNQQPGANPQQGGNPNGTTNLNIPGANIQYIPNPSAAPNAAPNQGTQAPQPTNQPTGNGGNGGNSTNP